MTLESVILWVTLGGAIGGIVTPFIYSHKGRDPISGALLGLLLGVVGNLVLLVPLWLLLPRARDESTVIASTTWLGGLGDDPLLAQRRSLPSVRTCAMLLVELGVLGAALVLVAGDILPALPSSSRLSGDRGPRIEQPPPRALEPEDILPTLTPIPYVPPKLITFPAAEMSATIVEAGRVGGTWETRHLGDSVGHLVGTTDLFDLGNVVLAGHVESHTGSPGPFRYLFEANIGDLVIISQGTRESYFAVSDIEIVDPYDVSWVAQSGPHRLTLITCTDWNPVSRTYDGRLVVIAEPTTMAAQAPN